MADEAQAPQGELLVYQGQGLNAPVLVRLQGETLWLTQRLMAELYGTTVANINQHITAIYEEGEHPPEATIKKYLIVQTEGARQVKRLIDHYNLDMILAVGFRVRSRRGSQFRQWAIDRLGEYLVKGFTMDDERLKGQASVVDYFDELLARIRDLGETKLYVPQGVQAYPTLRPLIGGTLNIKHVRAHWDDILRLASSIKQGTVTASLMLRKLGSYPRQNGLAVALRELGRIERTLFILDWLQSVELRRRVHAGLNKGEARNSLARAVFFNRLGEIRDRSFEQQRYRASGLNLVTAAIVLWNTVYLERATQGLVEAGKPVDGELLQFLSPLGWEHINLTGDYVWRQSRRLEDGKFRPLRMPGKP